MASRHALFPTDRVYSKATFLCPNSTEMIIQGQTYSQMFSYVEISVLGCDLPQGECADAVDTGNTYLQLFALQSRIDFEMIEKNDVLRMQQENVNLLVLDPSRAQRLNLFYTKSSLTLDDSPWKLFEIFKETFYFFEYMRSYKYEEVVDPNRPVAE